VPRHLTPSFGATVGDRLHLPHDPRAARDARSSLRADLSRRNVPVDIIDDAEIVLAELFGNAVRHARPAGDGSVIVHWRVLGEMVEVEVTDGGGPSPVRRDVEKLATGGLGLNIVAAMSRSWGVVDCGAERTVWASIVRGPQLSR
jgi:anti-sigma regulatory factor (Ser/Thr protein kinase)